MLLGSSLGELCRLEDLRSHSGVPAHLASDPLQGGNVDLPQSPFGWEPIQGVDLHQNGLDFFHHLHPVLNAIRISIGKPPLDKE